jgi:hypothetical protein
VESFVSIDYHKLSLQLQTYVVSRIEFTVIEWKKKWLEWLGDFQSDL